jgi:Mrp family chromosome partitioning ATPase/uncharacterized protein involved in exopolysaccharide biosynthesis
MDGAWALAVPPAARRGGRDDSAESQPLHKMHRLLRGRYKLAITMSAVLALGLGAAGYFVPKPQYQSNGLIEITPNIPTIGDTPIVMPLYTQYVGSQVNFMVGERVVLKAMEDDDWQPFKHGKPAEAVKEFVKKLNVDHVPGTFLVQVSFTDPNPARAKAAVGAVVRAYITLFADEDTRDSQQKLRFVDDLFNSSNNRKQMLEQRLSDLLSREKDRTYGMRDLGDLQAARIREMITIEGQLAQATEQLREAERRLSGEGEDGGAAGQKRERTGMTELEIAKVDPAVREYSLLKQRAADDLEAVRQRLGPKHPTVLASAGRLDAAEARLNEALEAFRASDDEAPVAVAGIRAPSVVTPKTVERLKEVEAALGKQREAARAEVAKLGELNMEVQDLEAQIKDLDEKMADAQRKREQINVQLAMSGRIKPQSYGNDPVIPAIDRRRQAAILGFLGGGSIPFVFFMLVGLSDKRFRYSDETKSDMGHVPLLGILPNLPDLLTDPQQAAVAAHCVHQIRTLLQVGVRTHDRHVYAVTSAAPGDGKTSLTLALGLSFAASGSRTLLIDCDLVGGSLTRRLGVHSSDGMLEAMGSRSPMDYVRDTDVNDLSILPVGSATMLSAGSFSPAGLRRLIAEARKTFDIVLIDTGPILGSIEAPPVAATADATILCVSRGQQRPAVERSMHHLLAIGAKMAGIVFNRAEAKDFEKSVSRFSQRSIRSGDNRGNGNGNLRLPNNGKGEAAAVATASAGVDPVTRAVQSEFKGDNGYDPR